MVTRLPYDERRIFSLVQQIQRAAMESAEWVAFNHAIGEMTDSKLVALYGYDLRTRTAQLASIQGISSGAARSYESYFAARSLTNRDTEHRSPGSVFLETMSDPHALRHCEAYNDFFLPRRIDHLALINLRNSAASRTTFTLRRGRHRGPYQDREVALLEFLCPFLRQSMDIWSQLEKLRGVERALHATLDRLPHGAVLLDQRGHLLFANRLAEDIIAHRDGLSVSREGGFRAANTTDNQRLSLLIDGCIRAGMGVGLHPGGAVAIARPSLKRAYGVHVFPVHQGSLPCGSTRPAAGMFITDPTRKHRPPHRILAELFHLTPAEERLARLMMEGLALKDCAEHMEISESTARSYSKSVYAKTGVSRQGDLVRLLFSSTLPVLGCDALR